MASTPSSRAVHTRGEFLEALDQILTASTLTLRVADPDLREQDWESEVRANRLGAFLRLGPERRLQFLVRQEDHLRQHCPRLMHLLRYRGHQMEVRVAGEEWTFPGGFILGDGDLLLQRHDAESWSGHLSVGDRPALARHQQAFTSLWDRLAGGMAYQPLGL